MVAIGAFGATYVAPKVGAAAGKTLWKWHGAQKYWALFEHAQTAKYTLQATRLGQAGFIGATVIISAAADGPLAPDTTQTLSSTFAEGEATLEKIPEKDYGEYGSISSKVRRASLAAQFLEGKRKVIVSNRVDPHAMKDIEGKKQTWDPFNAGTDEKGRKLVWQYEWSPKSKCASPKSCTLQLWRKKSPIIWNTISTRFIR